MMTPWLCVHLPYFRTERITRASSRTPADPVALVELRGDSVLLVAASQPAIQAGVRPGMTATAARSLVPSLVLVEHKQQAEVADFQALAAALGRFSPRVHLDCPRAILLDVSGCERLFGPAPALARQVVAAASRLGYVAQPGLADNPTAASALALEGGDGGGNLQDVSIAALRLEPSDLKHLGALGVRTLGALLALPLEGLSARFSNVLLGRLRELRGETQEYFPALEVPHTIVERLDFEGPTDRHDALLFALRRLAVALQERLAAQESGALALRVGLRGTEGGPITFSITLTRPTRESRSLAALLLGHFERVDRGERWFDGVEVEVLSHGQIKSPQRDLFGQPDPATDHSITELVDELSGRLGSDAVVGAVPMADPRPERSFVYQPFAQRAQAAPMAPSPRPATVFEPHEVTVDCDDSGMPLRWHDGRRSSSLVVSSLERVHFGWWAGDGGQRDYYIAQDDSGARWWLMQRDGRWFLVGAF